jgi:transcriptional regulator with XRE-family HTH domain
MSFLKRIKDLGENVSHRANLRKEKVATDLAILIAKEGLRRKDVAKKLGISEAALSSRLKGDANLTLDTIGGICDAASVEFDLVFRKRGVSRNRSYWEQVEPSVAATVVKQDMSHLLHRTRFALPSRGYAFETSSTVGHVAANDGHVVKAEYEQERIAA